jgi:hypothetical protein
MQPESQDCDRCEATIVDDGFSGVRPFLFAISTGEPDEFEQEQRVLCSACEEDLLAWVDGEYSREDAVELPDAYATGDTFRRFAQDLERMADEMEQS